MSDKGTPDALKREGWVRKKPSSHAKTPWLKAPIQRRYFVSYGYYVDYYQKQPAKEGPTAKPKGSFDLRRVTSVKQVHPEDTSAPPYAIEVIVGAHKLTIDFGYLDERSAWLKIWSLAIPPGVLPPELAGITQPDAELRNDFEALTVDQQENPVNVDDDDEPVQQIEAHPGPETVVKEGFLWKEGHRMHSWRKRYFRLTTWGNLKYYEDETSAEPKDLIPLGGSAVYVPNKTRASYPHAFRLQLDVARGEKHKYIISGESAAESQSWQQALLQFAALPAPRETQSARKGFLSSKATPMPPPRVSTEWGGPPVGPSPPIRVSNDGQGAAFSKGGLGGAHTPGSKRRVMVLGSTGNVGQATLHWLTQKHSSVCETFAGTRHPGRIRLVEGCIPIEADMNDPKQSWLVGLDVLIIITPGNDDRVPSTMRMVKEACKAGVTHLIVVSVITADLSESVFGTQFQQIENEVKMVGAHGAKFTLVRLPLFYENYYGFTGSVRTERKIRCCIDPGQLYSPIAVTDIGEALAAIAADTQGTFLDKTVSLAGESHSFAQLVSWLGEVTGTIVSYERETTDETMTTLLDFGFLKWQAQGILELYDMVSAGHYVYETTALEQALGHPPMTVKDWLKHASSIFAPVESGASEIPEDTAAEAAGEDLQTVGGEVPAFNDENRPRAPTALMMEQMEEVWNQVFLLESEGRFMEAAEHQASRLVEVKQQYDTNRSAGDAGATAT